MKEYFTERQAEEDLKDATGPCSVVIDEIQDRVRRIHLIVPPTWEAALE